MCLKQNELKKYEILKRKNRLYLSNKFKMKIRNIAGDEIIIDSEEIKK